MSKREELAAYLQKTVRVQVSDGRVIEGALQCVDKDMNLVLSQSIEYHGLSDVSSPQATDTIRSLGAVMVPGGHIKAIVVKDPSADSIPE
mgnify:CR=1 FL=1